MILIFFKMAYAAVSLNKFAGILQRVGTRSNPYKRNIISIKNSQAPNLFFFMIKRFFMTQPEAFYGSVALPSKPYFVKNRCTAGKLGQEGPLFEKSWLKMCTKDRCTQRNNKGDSLGRLKFMKWALSPSNTPIIISILLVI